MQRRSLADITAVARVSSSPERAARRRRLSRLAELLEQQSQPVRLFSTMECYPPKRRIALRQEGSPLSIAFADPGFRREGLAGDSVGEGAAFFGLSPGEAHALLCDCNYGGLTRIGAPLSQLVAERARRLARKRTLAEWRAEIALRLSRLAAVFSARGARG